MQVTTRTNSSRKIFSAHNTENNSLEITVGSLCEVRGNGDKGWGSQIIVKEWSAVPSTEEHRVNDPV